MVSGCVNTISLRKCGLTELSSLAFALPFGADPTVGSAKDGPQQNWIKFQCDPYIGTHTTISPGCEPITNMPRMRSLWHQQRNLELESLPSPPSWVLSHSMNKKKKIQPSAYYVGHTLIDTIDTGGKKANPNPTELVFPVLVLFPAIELKSRPASSACHVLYKRKHSFYLSHSILFYPILLCKLPELVPASSMLYHTGQTGKLGGCGYVREKLPLHLPTQPGSLFHENPFPLHHVKCSLSLTG